MKAKKATSKTKMTDAEIKEAIRRDKEWMNKLDPEDEIEIPEEGIKGLFEDDDDETEENYSDEFDAEDEADDDDVSGVGGMLGAIVGGIGGIIVGGMLGTALLDD